MSLINHIKYFPVKTALKYTTKKYSHQGIFQNLSMQISLIWILLSKSVSQFSASEVSFFYKQMLL
jgi:hypothetical protein